MVSSKCDLVHVATIFKVDIKLHVNMVNGVQINRNST